MRLNADKIKKAKAWAEKNGEDLKKLARFLKVSEAGASRYLAASKEASPAKKKVAPSIVDRFANKRFFVRDREVEIKHIGKVAVRFDFID